MATNIKNIYGIEMNDCKITGDIIVTDGTRPIISNSSKIGKKEDLAKEYADNLMKTSRPYHVQKYGMERAKNVADFDVYYVEQAYKKGWDACMKYLSDLPWDEAMNEIVNNCKEKEY